MKMAVSAFPIIALLLIFSPISNSFAQTDVADEDSFLFEDAIGDELSTRMVPEKLVKGSEALLHIYPTEKGPTPKQVDNLRAVSSDTEIISIGDIEDGGVITTVKILAHDTGEAKIALVADGFEPTSFTVIVYEVKNRPTQILLNAAPDTFAMHGPGTGYYTVQLTDDFGEPVIADKDIIINLSTSTDVISLDTKQMYIDEGQYYGIGTFNVNTSGNAMIFAASDGMDTKNKRITVSGPVEKSLDLFLFPEVISSQAQQHSYAVVVMKDETGKPTTAEKDTIITLHAVLDSEKTQTGDSQYSTEDGIDKYGNKKKWTGSLERVDESQLRNEASRAWDDYSGDKTKLDVLIKKGDSYGYSLLSSPVGIEGVYTIYASSPGFSGIQSKQLTVTPDFYIDNSPVQIKTIPSVSAGKNVLIGSVYLQDGNIPVTSDKSLNVRINPSDVDSVVITPPKIIKGSSVGLMFGNMGYTIKESSTLSDNSCVNTVTDGGEDSTTSNCMATDLYVVGGFGSDSAKLDVFGPTKADLKFVAKPMISKVIPDTDFPVVAYMTRDESSVWYFPENIYISKSPSSVIDILGGQIKSGDSPKLFMANAKDSGADIITMTAGEYETDMNIEVITAKKPAKLTLSSPDDVYTFTESLFLIQLLDESNNPVFSDRNLLINLFVDDTSKIRIPESVVIEKGTDHATFTANAASAGSVKLLMLAENLPEFSNNIEIVSKPIVENPLLDNTNSTKNDIETVPEKKRSLEFMGVDLLLIIVPGILAGVGIMLKRNGTFDSSGEKLK